MSTFNADIVVIGAGIVGAACAWRLAQRGLKVIVVEQGTPAHGSSSRGAGGVRAQFNTATNILLSRESIAEYADMPDSGYQPAGYLMLVPEAGWAAAQEALALQQNLGIPSEQLTFQDAQRFVEFDPSGLGGCSHCPIDGYVDPPTLTRAFVSQAQEAGAQFLLHTTVERIERRGGLWEVGTPAGTVSAPQLLNASGAWAGQVGALAGLDLPVRPARRMVFATRALAPAPQLPFVFDLESGVWIRSKGDRLLLGRADANDTGWREDLDWNWLAPTLQLAVRRFPWLDSVGFDRQASWFGYYEVTPDHQPLLGRMPGVDGWLNACGFSGHGVMQAAATARVMAQEACGEEPFIDIGPLRYDRFQSGRAVLDMQL